MDSILQKDKSRCMLCGRRDETLEEHHVFEGNRRAKSERYGLKVYLCGNRCHRNGEHAVHRDIAVQKRLKEWAQHKAMAHYKWSMDEWMQIMGKNYLTGGAEHGKH